MDGAGGGAPLDDVLGVGQSMAGLVSHTYTAAVWHL